MITDHTADSLIAFESRIRAHWEAGNLPCLLHLCGGNEEQLLEIFREIRPGDWVFSTHRNHYHALLSGIPADQLEASILRGDSMFVFRNCEKQPSEASAKEGALEKEGASAKEGGSGVNFYTSAILAGTCGIAAGVAYALQQARGSTPSPLAPSPSPVRSAHVYCFLGDGAEEEGHFYEAVLFVEAHDLPCTFIIEDNDRQVDTDKATRRGPGHDKLWAAFAHAPLDHFRCVLRYHYTPTYPHAGSGAAPGTITFQPAAIERLRSAP